MDTTMLLNNIIEGKNLTTSQSSEMLTLLMGGVVPPIQAGAILTALRMKGETTEEILGFVRAMRAHMRSIDARNAVDIVGTGGDGSGTFNISTTAAFVVAGARIKVAKHGNRAASSKCGSADVLEALGVNIQLLPDEASKVLERAGMVFFFAPLFHPATKQVVSVRKELNIRTVFNMLGPFTNPGNVEREVMGVANISIAEKLATVAQELDYKRILIVSSEDGMDEISISAKTIVFDVKGRHTERYVIDPEKLGFSTTSLDDIRGEGAMDNANIVMSVLRGEKGPHRDVVLLNAAAALVVAGRAVDIRDGIRISAESIDTGNAAETLKKLVFETQKFRKTGL